MSKITTTDKARSIIKPAWAGSRSKVKKPKDKKPTEKMSWGISIKDYISKRGKCI
jgi:hypothetical protein